MIAVTHLPERCSSGRVEFVDCNGRNCGGGRESEKAADQVGDVRVLVGLIGQRLVVDKAREDHALIMNNKIKQHTQTNKNKGPATSQHVRQ